MKPEIAIIGGGYVGGRSRASRRPPPVFSRRREHASSTQPRESHHGHASEKLLRSSSRGSSRDSYYDHPDVEAILVALRRTLGSARARLRSSCATADLAKVSSGPARFAESTSTPSPRASACLPPSMSGIVVGRLSSPRLLAERVTRVRGLHDETTPRSSAGSPRRAQVGRLGLRPPGIEVHPVRRPSPPSTNFREPLPS